MDALWSLLALLVTLGVLISFHEYGHFWVARRMGVKVLRFSVGFGRPLWMRRGRVDGTEFALAAIPLGGYVRMLDEREGAVPARERHRAFNRQSVWRRIAIVAAGPLANFLFAILAYWLIFMIGVGGIRPVIDAPVAESAAARAGLERGDLLLAVDGRAVRTLDATVLALVDRALAGGAIALEVESEDGRRLTRYLEPVPGAVRDAGSDVLEVLGIRLWQPEHFPATIGRVLDGGAAGRDGLLGGDRIISVAGQPVHDWTHWVEIIRASPGDSLPVTLEREGVLMQVTLTPEPVTGADGGVIGQIGAAAEYPPEAAERLSVVVRHGPLAALWAGVTRTGEMSALTVRMLARMVIGKASLENLGGPVTIAHFAGQSASFGIVPFLSFLALVSISLGILNLLPIPVLDGGHLLYYLIELVKGSPLSDAAQEIGQRVGLVLLLMLMSLALFNDFARLLG